MHGNKKEINASARAQKAVSHFRGKDGAERLNCAQSVATAFLDSGRLSAEQYGALAGCGFGKAPEGRCGSYYAAFSMLNSTDPSKAEEFSRDFEAFAGSINCSAIRAARKVSCLDTVLRAVEIAERLSA